MDLRQLELLAAFLIHGSVAAVSFVWSLNNYKNNDYKWALLWMISSFLNFAVCIAAVVVLALRYWN